MSLEAQPHPPNVRAAPFNPYLGERDSLMLSVLPIVRLTGA